MKELLEKLCADYVATLDDETNVALWNTDRNIASAEIGNFLKSEVVANSINAHDKLVSDNVALRAQIAAKDEIANQVLNDALAMKDPVREQLIEALMRALPFVEECQDSTHFKDGYVKARVTQIRAALTAAGAV